MAKTRRVSAALSLGLLITGLLVVLPLGPDAARAAAASALMAASLAWTTTFLRFAVDIERSDEEVPMGGWL